MKSTVHEEYKRTRTISWEINAFCESIGTASTRQQRTLSWERTDSREDSFTVRDDASDRSGHAARQGWPSLDFDWWGDTPQMALDPALTSPSPPASPSLASPPPRLAHPFARAESAAALTSPTSTSEPSRAPTVDFSEAGAGKVEDSVTPPSSPSCFGSPTQPPSHSLPPPLEAGVGPANLAPRPTLRWLQLLPSWSWHWLNDGSMSCVPPLSLGETVQQVAASINALHLDTQAYATDAMALRLLKPEALDRWLQRRGFRSLTSAQESTRHAVPNFFASPTPALPADEAGVIASLLQLHDASPAQGRPKKRAKQAPAAAPTPGVRAAAKRGQRRKKGPPGRGMAGALGRAAAGLPLTCPPRVASTSAVSGALPRTGAKTPASLVVHATACARQNKETLLFRPGTPPMASGPEIRFSAHHSASEQVHHLPTIAVQPPSPELTPARITMSPMTLARLQTCWPLFLALEWQQDQGFWVTYLPNGPQQADLKTALVYAWSAHKANCIATESGRVKAWTDDLLALQRWVPWRAGSLPH